MNSDANDWQEKCKILTTALIPALNDIPDGAAAGVAVALGGGRGFISHLEVMTQNHTTLGHVNSCFDRPVDAGGGGWLFLHLVYIEQLITQLYQPPH